MSANTNEQSAKKITSQDLAEQLRTITTGKPSKGILGSVALLFGSAFLLAYLIGKLKGHRSKTIVEVKRL